MRSFNVVNNFVEENCEQRHASRDCDESSSEGNIDLTETNVINKRNDTALGACNPLHLSAADLIKGFTSLDTDVSAKIEDTDLTSPAPYLLDNSSATADHSLTDKSEPIDVPASSEDSKSNCFKHPVFITSTMENSNNAVDSVPLFSDVRMSENVFKLPIRELTFNGTIKHVKKLKPIVDPMSALTSNSSLVHLDEKSVDNIDSESNYNVSSFEQRNCPEKVTDSSDASSEVNRNEKSDESTGDSQYEDKKECGSNDDGNSKWNLEQSYSSLEASFDSGVRSPDMFSDEDEADPAAAQEPFWSFLKDFEAYDKRRVRKLEVSVYICFKQSVGYIQVTDL